MLQLLNNEMKWKGYIGQLLEFVKQEQLLDSDLWKLFVEQYRKKNDTDNGWRGEYWGKMMRGAVLTYICTADEKLYTCMENTVCDLLSTQEADGRMSSYPREKEFNDWDIWCRKYVLLGNLYFYDICKDESLKTKILNALSAHLDYIIARVGEEDGKKSIFETSQHYGCLNSCSILEPVVKMYKHTKKQEYLKFAKYIVDGGFCKDMNIIEECLNKTKYPYQFKHTKAYEMMSCFQGLLEYYEVTNESKYFVAVQNFADMVKESDITMIGCAGCRSEFFDNSSIRQTEYSEEVMQETCVTVTWMNLCYKLLQMTGKAKYADWMECSALNAMSGAVNTERQGALRAYVWDGAKGEVYTGERDKLPFDSYSPLYKNRRGKGIGGFNVMEAGRSYGCCAAIGSAGVALTGLFGVLKTSNGLCVNLYQNGVIKTKIDEQAVTLSIEDRLLSEGRVNIKVDAKGSFALMLRIPEWSSNDYVVLIDGAEVPTVEENGYITLEKDWNAQTICLKLDMSVKKHILNGKIAFKKGAYVLSQDPRLGCQSLSSHFLTNDFETQIMENDKFPNNVTVRIKTGEQSVVLCDYAQAGKNFDDENCDISVWIDTANENMPQKEQ